MILVADSGATKSDWVLLDGASERIRIQLDGLNPFYLSPDEIHSLLVKELVPLVNEKKISHIFFYGAGCGSAYKALVMEETIGQLFPSAHISVESDLLGAARALFGDEPGIAAILGTGANAGIYNGRQLTDKTVSLGYFFGDEGSGAHMGKMFIHDYLLGELPGDLAEAFKCEYNYTRDNILDAVYNLPFPNRFLASFTKFIAAHLKHPYIFDMVTNSFRAFFGSYIVKLNGYQKYRAGFTGSVAFFFEPVLREVAAEYKIEISKIQRDPIEGLSAYHRSERNN
ncbi:MAG: ATPase [Bacteroidales bacterium]